LYCNFDECACFLGYYVAKEFATAELLHSLVQQYETALSLLRDRFTAYSGQAGVYDAAGLSSNDLVFTTRIILYVDGILEDDLKRQLDALGVSLGVWVQIRDRRYEEFITMNETPLGFISHDSRDKDSFVRPLAERLRSALCPVWYDEFSLRPGDGLRESIDAGLRDSRRCVVVLSPNFFTNPGWGKAEFSAILNRQFSSGGNVLIPIWYGVTREQVAEYSPLVVNTIAINSDIGFDEVVGSVHRALLRE
jgi:TIR domain